METPSIPTVSNTTEISPSPIPKPPYKIPWILLLIVLLLGCGIGGILLGKQMFRPVLTPVPSPTAIIPTPIPTAPTFPPFDSSSWKTFTSLKLKMSFKYPSNLFVAENNDSIYIDTQKIEFPSVWDGMLTPVQISVHNNTDSRPQDDSEIIDSYRRLFTSESYKVQAISIPGAGFHFSGIGEGAYVGGSNYESIYLKGEPPVTIDFIPNEKFTSELFNQILSTLKFTTNNSFELKAPDSQYPAAGVCADFSKDTTINVGVIIGPDNVSQPRCVKVSSQQHLMITNNKTEEIIINLGSVQEVISSGKTVTFNQEFGSLLQPGVHFTGGPEVWLQP